jgi:hypothetical protein
MCFIQFFNQPLKLFFCSYTVLLLKYKTMVLSKFTIIPFTLYPRRGIRDISDISPRHRIAVKINENKKYVDLRLTPLRR